MGNGFDLVPFVHPDAAIIFVTGCDDHAVRAFEVNAVDYILKPVVEERLAEALRRVKRARGQEGETVRRYKSSDRIFLRGAAAGGRFVPVGEITAIVSSENYSEVLLACGERWFVRQTMHSWGQSLPSDTFLRVHRTAIINLYRVERVERNAEEKHDTTTARRATIHSRWPTDVAATEGAIGEAASGMSAILFRRGSPQFVTGTSRHVAAIWPASWMNEASATPSVSATGNSNKSPREGISSTRATASGDSRKCQHTSVNTASHVTGGSPSDAKTAFAQA